jgi:hypothetical protein
MGDTPLELQSYEMIKCIVDGSLLLSGVGV